MSDQLSMIDRVIEAVIPSQYTTLAKRALAIVILAAGIIWSYNYVTTQMQEVAKAEILLANQETLNDHGKRIAVLEAQQGRLTEAMSEAASDLRVIRQILTDKLNDPPVAKGKKPHR